MRPASTNASRRGSVTSTVSDASLALRLADCSTSRRAPSASVTLSLARLIAAPCVLRSSGDILPSVESSAEIEPFLPSEATRTASRAVSSPAAAISARMVCSRVARSDTVKISLQKAAGCRRYRAETSSKKPVTGLVLLNPVSRVLYQREFEKELAMRFGPWTAILAVVLSLAAASARAEDCPARTTQMDDIIVALNEAPSCDRAMKIFEACE